MAVDPTKAKRNINFDTFAQEKEGSRINWFEQAKTISDAFTGVATDRQERKDAIDADTKKNLDALNELDQMDNKTLMDMTIDGANNAANAIYEAEQKMKRGELRPQDFQKLKNNISSGFTQFQKNAKSWDEDFKRYSERMQGGESSTLEQYLGERMESFGNLKNLQLVTNPETGMLAFGRIDENGNLLTGPDDLISMNRMTAISKQEINKIDVGAAAVGAVEELGTFIKAGNAGTMDVDGMGPRAVVTIKDFMQTPQADKYITDKANELLNAQGNFSIGSVLADNGVQNSLGEEYRAGDQAAFDKWASDNPNADQSQNPVIVMGYKENGVVVEPALTDGQKERALTYAKDQIKAGLDNEVKATDNTFQYNQPNAANIAAGRADEKELDLGKNVNMMVTGDAREAESAMQYLVSASNGNISSIEKTSDGIVINYPNKKPMTISTKGKTSDEAMREVWKGVGMNTEYDSYVRKGGDIGKTVTYDAVGVGGPEALVEYDSNTNVRNEDGDEVSAVDWVNKSSLGKSLNSMNDSNAEVTQVFTELISKPEFYPKGIGGGKVEMDGDNMTFTIGNTPYDLGDVFAMETSDIVQAMQKRIQMEVDKANKGGGVGGDNTGGQFNSPTTPTEET